MRTIWSRAARSIAPLAALALLAVAAALVALPSVFPPPAAHAQVTNNAPTGAPSITGTPQLGMALTSPASPTTTACRRTLRTSPRHRRLFRGDETGTDRHEGAPLRRAPGHFAFSKRAAAKALSTDPCPA